MNILFLSRWYPYPADNGSKIRVYNLLQFLATRHNVTLLSFTQENLTPERLDGMRALCSQVHALQYKSFQPSSMKSLVGFFSRWPRSFRDTHNPEMQALVERLHAESPFDLVIASQFDMAPYALALKGVPKLLEEVEISIFRDQYLKETHPLKKARKRLMWMKWNIFMRDILSDFAGCTVVSEPEIEPIQEIVPGYNRVAVIPNGADLGRLTMNLAPPQPSTLVYTGSLTYYVNFDAMKFFLGEVFPLIQAECPQVKLQMAGRLDGVPLGDLPACENARHIGHQQDIRPLVAGSWASIVPERVGGGTRIKVLESMALGTPVIATTRAATGLNLTPGYDVLVADQPRAFAEAALRLLRDPDLRLTLSQNGRRTIETHYDWNVIGEKLDDLLHKLAPVSQRKN